MSPCRWYAFSRSMVWFHRWSSSSLPVCRRWAPFCTTATSPPSGGTPSRMRCSASPGLKNRSTGIRLSACAARTFDLSTTVMTSKTCGAVSSACSGARTWRRTDALCASSVRIVSKFPLFRQHWAQNVVSEDFFHSSPVAFTRHHPVVGTFEIFAANLQVIGRSDSFMRVIGPADEDASRSSSNWRNWARRRRRRFSASDRGLSETTRDRRFRNAPDARSRILRRRRGCCGAMPLTPRSAHRIESL